MASNPFLKKIALLILCGGALLSLQGCAIVGVGWFGATEVEVRNPPEYVPLMYLGGKPAEGRVSPNSPQATTANLEEVWGPPKTFICLPNGKEIWSYREDERRWSGLLIGLIVPVPLMLPTEGDRIDFHIEDGKVTKAKFRMHGDSSCFYITAMSAEDDSWHNRSECYSGKYRWALGKDRVQAEMGRTVDGLPTACADRAKETPHQREVRLNTEREQAAQEAARKNQEVARKNVRSDQAESVCPEAYRRYKAMERNYGQPQMWQGCDGAYH